MSIYAHICRHTCMHGASYVVLCSTMPLASIEIPGSWSSTVRAVAIDLGACVAERFAPKPVRCYWVRMACFRAVPWTCGFSCRVQAPAKQEPAAGVCEKKRVQNFWSGGARGFAARFSGKTCFSKFRAPRKTMDFACVLVSPGIFSKHGFRL
jgi:hypothetical protein